MRNREFDIISEQCALKRKKSIGPLDRCQNGVFACARRNKSLAEANALSQLSRADGYRQPCFPGALQQ